jgi:hypothetical protein
MKEHHICYYYAALAYCYCGRPFFSRIVTMEADRLTRRNSLFVTNPVQQPPQHTPINNTKIPPPFIIIIIIITLLVLLQHNVLL